MMWIYLSEFIPFPTGGWYSLVLPIVTIGHQVEPSVSPPLLSMDGAAPWSQGHFDFSERYLSSFLIHLFPKGDLFTFLLRLMCV